MFWRKPTSKDDKQEDINSLRKAYLDLCRATQLCLELLEHQQEINTAQQDINQNFALRISESDKYSTEGFYDTERILKMMAKKIAKLEFYKLDK